MRYNVYKYFQDGRRALTIRRGVDLATARAICADPETSSRTARKPRGCDNDDAQIERWSDARKHWFYGYTEA